jgi:hypothetical protein
VAVDALVLVADDQLEAPITGIDTRLHFLDYLTAVLLALKAALRGKDGLDELIREFLGGLVISAQAAAALEEHGCTRLSPPQGFEKLPAKLARHEVSLRMVVMPGLITGAALRRRLWPRERRSPKG